MGQGASHGSSNNEGSNNQNEATSSSSTSQPAGNTPTRLRSTLAHSRSIKRDRDRDSAKDGGSKPPRRKSLDMPDMSLSMTGTGTITATPSALPTPSLAVAAAHDSSRSSRSSTTSSSTAATTQGYPYPGTPVSQSQSQSGADEDFQSSLNTGIPMANSPLGPISPTSPVAQAAAAASRWARVKNREGLMKKAQPVTGSAAALNAVAYQNSLSQQQQQVPSNASSATSSGTHTPTYNTNKQGQILHPVVTSTASGASSPYNAPQSLAGALDSLGSPLSPASAAATQPSIFATSLTSNATALNTPVSSFPPTPLAILPPAPTPLKQPTETVLAPKLPADVVSLVVSPSTTVPILPQELLGPRLALAVANAAANVSSSSSSSSSHLPDGGATSSNAPSGQVSRSSSTATIPGMTASATSSYPATPPPEMYNTITASPQLILAGSAGGGSGSVPPGSTPPLGNPPNTLPAAAPIETILLQNNHDMNLNLKTKEAVENATLNCFVKEGEEGVTTLLTWKAEEEEAASAQNNGRLTSPGSKNNALPPGMKGKGKYTNDALDVEQDELASHAATPRQVFVTGTFANQWGTKVELRRKEGEDGTPTTNDFTALVKMPPGPHTLKFIVDKQWKTSKYLPSATDADGNLINYLQVNKPEEIAAIGEVISQQQQHLRQQQKEAAASSNAGPSSGSAAGTGTHSPVAAAVMAAAMAGIAVTTPDGTVASPSYSYQHYFQQANNGGFGTPAGPTSPVAGPSGSPAVKTAQAPAQSPSKATTPPTQDKTATSSSPARQRGDSTAHKEASHRTSQAPNRYQPPTPQRSGRSSSAFASIEQTLQWEDDSDWTSEIPEVLIAYGDASEAALDFQEAQERALAEKQGNLHSHSGGLSSLPPPNLPTSISSSNSAPNTPLNAHDDNSLGGASSIPSNVPQHPSTLLINRKPLSQLISIQPPTLPAQLEKGVLNATVLVAKGSGDDNSILPRPDHSVLNHLAASPIKGGLLSVGVTTRYRQKYVTTVYYKKPV